MLTDSEARGLAAFNDLGQGQLRAVPHFHRDAGLGQPPAVYRLRLRQHRRAAQSGQQVLLDAGPEYNPDGRRSTSTRAWARSCRATPSSGSSRPRRCATSPLTGPYTHNGYFKTLRGVLDFYNTRDVKPACADKFTREADAIAQGCWPVAEQPKTMNTVNLGNLHLSDQDVDDIVAFMGTLTDGWTPTGAKAHAAR